jgi:peptide/nickel transport system permease protein
MTARAHALVRYVLGDWKLAAGLLLVAVIVLFGPVAALFVDHSGTDLGAGGFAERPSGGHLLGTDTTGRDIFALMVYGIPPTLEIGLLAGALGTVAGVILGLVSGYFRGPADTLIRGAADIVLTIPPLAVLVVLAAFLQTTTVTLMAAIVALFAWPWTTRAMRSQTLTLREQGFVAMAKLSGRGNLQILFLEILPNLLPYVMATFVAAVSGAILVTVGLQLLALGPTDTVTLGLVLEYAFEYGAIARGMWWWWGPPTVLLVVLFIALFLLSMALDEISNPRLKRARV